MSQDQSENPPAQAENPPGENAAQQEAEKWKNDFLYLRAEFENYKRNAIKERSDLAKYGSERIIRDLLPVMDNFERALSTPVTAQNFSDYKKGVEMTAAELKNVLQKNGVQEIPSEGKPFDPQFHEALSSEGSEEVPEGHVVRVFQKAYKMHDKVIRAGQVVVSKKSNGSAN